MAGERHLNSDEWIIALIGHGLEVAGDAAIGLGESLCTKATGDLLFDLAHSQIALGTVVGEGDVRELGKEQDSGFMSFEAFPEVVGVRFGNAASLAVLPGGKGREFLFTPGQDIAVSFLKILVFSARQFLVFTLCNDDASLLKQTLHIGRPGVAVGVDNEGQFPQQVRATETVAAVVVGEIRGPAVVDDDSTIAWDDADGLDRLGSPLGMEEFQGDIAPRINMDPVLLLLDAQRSLVDMHRGHGQELFDSPLFPRLQALVQLQDVLEHGCFGDHLSDECLDRLLHSLEGDHLRHDHVEDVGLDAGAILQGTGHARGETTLRARLTARALLDLCIHVADHFLEDDIHLRASFMPDTRAVCEILTAGFTDINFSDLNGFYRSGVAGPQVVLLLALALGTGLARSGVVLGCLRGGFAGIPAVLGRASLHEHGHEQFEEHQHGLEQGAAFRAHLPFGAKALETRLQRVEFFPKRLPVDTGHDRLIRRMAGGSWLLVFFNFNGKHGRQYRQTFRPGQCLVASCPVGGFALDLLSVGKVPTRVAGPMDSIHDEVEPEFFSTHTVVVHDLKFDASPPLEQLLIQCRGVAGDHHLARQCLEKFQQFDMIRFFVVEPVSAGRRAGAQQIRGVTVDQLRTLIRVISQKPMRTSVDQFYRIGAFEARDRLRIQVDTDVSLRWRLTLHDRAPAQMRLNVGVMRRHHRDDRLAQTRRCLRPKITHCLGPNRLPWTRSIVCPDYVVKSYSEKSFSLPRWEFCSSAAAG